MITILKHEKEKPKLKGQGKPKKQNWNCNYAFKVYDWQTVI